ncbi:MAG TPA: 50S ribosomal protein L23 [Caldilineaceae bacterium]|nr:50S ribosomal protein L23 [Caldilineaceae bacterium]
MHIYEVIRRPVVTEKTMIGVDEGNRYAFEVDMRANKFQVKDAVELAFDVTVTDVHIMVMPAKTARRGKRIVIRKPKWKKAIVSLAPGDRIQLFEGV